MKYRAEIDGLRAVALLPVVFSHAGFSWFKGTYVMIDLFFVISGYLITSLIAKEKTQGTFSLVQFYERRARRLLPALFVMMAVCIPLAWFLLFPSDFVLFSKSLISVPTFSSNFLFWSEAGYFKPDNRMKPFLQTWSLSVEEQFYLLFPLVFVWLWPHGKKKVTGFLIVLSLISIGCMNWGLENDIEANWYLLPGRIWEFTLGAILALLPERPVQSEQESRWAQILSLSGLTILLVSVFTFNEYQPFPSFYTLLPLAGTALIIRFSDSTNWVGKLLGSRLLVGVGLISYGVFVWHQPLFAFARHYYSGPVAPLIYAMLILLSFVLAYLSWKYVEAPFRNRNFLKRRVFFSGCLIISLAFVSLGFVGVKKEGLPGRFPNGTIKLDSILEKAMRNGPPVNGWPRAQFNRNSPFTKFIEGWRNTLKTQTPLKKIPLAIFGSSYGADIYDGLKRNGFQAVGLFEGGCPLNPSRMTETCLTLAKTLIDFIREEKNIKYLALISAVGHPSEMTESYLNEVINFWEPLPVKLIIFSDKTRYDNLRGALLKLEYPKPNLDFAIASLRSELRDLATGRGVHLVDANQVFCKTTGTCDFKKGPRANFNPEDFILFDPKHFTPVGQKEFGRVLLEIDPIFKQIVNELPTYGMGKY